MPDFTPLLEGFATALSPQNILFLLIGVTLGTLVGALPGLGPLTTMALMLPFALTLDPAAALIMFGGIYYGSQYGGTITSVLLNVPGEISGVMTALEGHQLAKQGRAGPVLGIAALSSFIAGTIGVVLIVVLGSWISSFAYEFGPAEYFALTVLGLTLVSTLVGRTPLKGFAMAFVGVLLSLVGTDPIAGTVRLDFGWDALVDGIGFVPVAVGLFGLGEVFNLVYQKKFGEEPVARRLRIRDVYPTRKDLRESAGPIARGTVVGFLVGVLPGAGASIASFLSYGLEHKIARGAAKAEFGHGSMRGVAGPEGANNSATAGSIVTMLSLGIPGSGVTAFLLVVLVLFGVQIGPGLINTQPEVVWPFIASMYLGNVALLVLNTAFIPIFVWIVRKTTRWVNAFIIAVCLIGVYAYAYHFFDVALAIAFGLLGVLFRRFGYPMAPLLLGLVLGPIAEVAFRQSLIISNGSLEILVNGPIKLTILIVALLVIISPLLGLVWRRIRRKPAGLIARALGEDDAATRDES